MMRADAAPFVPSVLLNSSTISVECAEEKKQERQQEQRQRRRRRRGKQGSSSKHNSSSHPPQPTKQNEPLFSSQTTQRQKLQQHRKRRSRRRKASSQNSEEDAQLKTLDSSKKHSEQDLEITSKEQDTNHHRLDGINYDKDCFPTLASDYNDTCTKYTTHADSSWGECLVTKLAISEMEQQQQQQKQDIDYDQDEFSLHFNSDVQLTKLSRSSRRIIKDNDDDVIDTQINNDGDTNTNEKIDNVQSTENKNNCMIVPNAKWKWNDTELSKMRQRWWTAVKDKQTKDAERVTQHKSMASFRTSELLEDDSSTSSDSSSLFSLEDDDDDPMQPPSLSKPFDEMPIEQHNTDLIFHNARISPSVLELETMCCETPYPLHAVIYIHALQNPSLCDKVGDSLTSSSKPDSEFVLHRLLTLQDQDDVEQWRMQRVDLNEICQLRTPSTWIKDILDSIEEIASVDDKELTPLQLAIVLNCPDIVRILSSSKSTLSMGGKNDSEHGYTSLLLACELGHATCIKALLCSSNIKLDYRDRVSGNSAYHFCCLGRVASTNDDNDKTSNVSALDTLMSHTPNAIRKRVLLLTNREGRNLAHIACARGDLLLLKCVIGHLSNVSSQMPWKALTVPDRLLGHTPFISAVHAGKCEIVAHLLITRFPAADYSVLFSVCPLTIAASNYDLAMATLLFEMGYDTQTTTSSDMAQIIRYDINRSLLELMLIRCGMDDGEEVDADNFELIRLLVANGANPHKAVSIRNQQKPKTRGDDNTADLAGEEDTPLSVAVMAGDFQSIECMLHSYMHALVATHSLRRKDPLLISQPESYFIGVERRETDTIQDSLQSALVKALFLIWQSGDVNIGKCCLVLYRRGVTLSLRSLQWLEKCISVNRFVVPSSSWDYSAFYFEAPSVQYFLPEVSLDTIEATNPYANLGAFMCWSHVLLALPWTNRFSFNCKWIRNDTNSDFDSDKLNSIPVRDSIHHLLDDEFYLVVEDEKLLLHKSIISAKSGKLAAAISFMEAQGLYNEEDKLCVSIDLPALLAKMLVCHIYHGSVSFGLMTSPVKRCEQLLELALVAEEYLCPSLLMEVEMRLLETKSNECFCAYCSGAAMTPTDHSICPIAVEFLEHAEQNECRPSGIYYYKASRFSTSSLITPESAINVLAVAQQLNLSSSSENGSYALKFTTRSHDESVASTDINVERDRNAGVLTAPFLACKIVASFTLLRGFKLFMERQANKKDDDGDGDIPLLVGRERNHSVVDESCILLLRECLEELALNPLRPLKMMRNENSRWCIEAERKKVIN